MTLPPEPRPAAHPKGEDSRAAILRAAVAEFAKQGAAGARMEAIARVAGVNKALLFYYFGSKEALYGRVLDEIFTGMAERYARLLKGPDTPGIRLLRYFLALFDHLAESGPYARLLGYEMMRARTGEPSHIPHLAQVFFGPLHRADGAAVADGVAAGELRPVEPGGVEMFITGGSVFYFMSAPVMRALGGQDPRDPERLARQRVMMLDHVATLLFTDPEQGRQLARRIQAEGPAPSAVSKGNP